MINKNCFYCNKKFQVFPSNIKIKFCSRNCYYNSMKGIKYSKERNQKISNSMKNKTKTKEHCKKLSISASLRKPKYGEKSNAWKGGKTKLNLSIRSLEQNKIWKFSCLKRDNFKCQNCNIENHNLHVHHIKKLSKIILQYKIKNTIDALNCKFLWDINNGISLCKKCHNRIHYK